ncbi:hypothetical protein FQR65_LT06849 [Abscondita terminalis]|nr:hypothetical protein FQR65_LT06849 [Abscondita terminalis]
MEMQEYSAASHKVVEQRKKFKKFMGHTENISPFAGALFIFAIFSFYAIVYLIDDISPRSLYIEDEDEFVDRFIAERARNDLKELTNIGPRVVGTYQNEVVALELLKRKILTIIEEGHKNQKIEVDIQVVSGSVKSSPYSTLVYENVQNVVVKVHAEKYSEHSLLINTHFDSAPTSPGGSDNGINCAVALEVLRKMAKSHDTLKHNVIYLFNGAEEVGLLGAQAFITHHRWAREVKAFVNLDANGAGGRLMLFQLGPKQHWLLKYVRQITLPNAQVVGEELIENELLPFDTDYSVFTKVGKTVGLNFAFTRNGYRYHTRYDDFENIPLSTYQHTGDMLLHLVKNLGNATELAFTSSQPLVNSIYYDFLGLFLIYYTNTIGIVINVLVSLFSVLIAVKSFYDFRVTSKHSKYIGLTLFGLILGWIAAAVFVTIIGVSLNALHYNMVWYNNLWIVLGLYITPTFVIPSIISQLFKRFVNTDVTYNMHAQLQCHFLRLIWTALLLIGTCLSIRSMYVILMPIFTQTSAFLLIHATCSQYTKRVWQIVYFIFSIPSTLQTMYLLLMISTTFIPSLGFIIGNTELQVAYFYLFFTTLISSTFVPFITVVRKSYIVILTYSLMFIACLITMFTPIAVPYNDNPDSPALQRFTVIYENTITRVGLDNNVYGRSYKLDVSGCDQNFNQTLEKYVSEPEFVKETDLIPMNMSVKVTLNNKKYITDSQTHYNFTIQAPAKMFLRIQASENIIVTYAKLHLADTELILRRNWTRHYIRYRRGKESQPMVLILKTKHIPNPNAPLLTFYLNGDYQYNASALSIPYLNKYLEQFPTWTNVEAQLSVSDTMIF